MYRVVVAMEHQIEKDIEHEHDMETTIEQYVALCRFRQGALGVLEAKPTRTSCGNAHGSFHTSRGPT